MNVLYLLLFCGFGYGLYLIFQKKYRSSILYTLAIGSIVNAGIFNVGNFPIAIGNLNFGMNSVVYTLFLFCVIMMYIYYGKKDTITLVVCSLGAIIFAAVIEFLTCLGEGGYASILGIKMIIYFGSCISSIMACLAMVSLYHKLKKLGCNIYVNLFLNLLAASIVDTFIYYAIKFCTHTSTINKNLLLELVALYLGKLIAIGLSLITVIVVNTAFKEDKIPYQKSGCEELNNDLHQPDHFPDLVDENDGNNGTQDSNINGINNT